MSTHGTFDLALQEVPIQVNGLETTVSVVKASEEGTIDMTSAVWIRDMSRIAESMMKLYQLDPVRFATEGAQAKKMLTSSLTLMSTPAQLSRFDKTILNETDRDNHDTWPHIRLGLNNLDGAK